MGHGRWYRRRICGPDGSTVILSGLNESGVGYDGGGYNDEVEVFVPDPNPNGTNGKVKLLATPGLSSGANNGTTGRRGLYPHTFVLPDGRTLVAGPWRRDNWMFDYDLQRGDRLGRRMDDLAHRAAAAATACGARPSCCPATRTARRR